jgi:hypothetical protein
MANETGPKLPSTPLPPPSKLPRITFPTDPLPGLWSIIRHPFKPGK